MGGKQAMGGERDERRGMGGSERWEESEGRQAMGFERAMGGEQ